MFGTLMRISLILGCVGTLSACGVRDRIFGADHTDFGLPYAARLATGDTPREFTVTVQAAGASLAEARESARFPATRHCIDRFGLSDVAWEMDATSGDWAVSASENGDLTVAGRCLGR